MSAKAILRYPKLIAPILKNVVPEFKNYSVDEVIDFIVKDSISSDPVDDVSCIAQPMETEMSSMSEKLVQYDSRFKVLNPLLSSEMININLHIDIEVQNDYTPGNPTYPIIKRGIYYGAREISSQLGVLTHTTDYNAIEKVYSIWICNENIPEIMQNTISSYKITKADEIGLTNEPEKDYDLMTIIIIRRGRKAGEANIFGYLEALFTSDIERICKYVDISDDEVVKREVSKMEGLGQSIYDRGVAAGEREGRAEGQKMLAQAIKDLRKGMKYEELVEKYDQGTADLAMSIK